MGIYVYTLRKDTRPVEIEGEYVPVARASFSFKETLGRTSGSQASKIAAAERARYALEDVEYVMFGDKFEDGCAVRRVSLNWSSGVDTPEWPGERVGILRYNKNLPRGQRWYVEPCYA